MLLNTVYQGRLAYTGALFSFCANSAVAMLNSKSFVLIGNLFTFRRWHIITGMGSKVYISEIYLYNIAANVGYLKYSAGL